MEAIDLSVNGDLCEQIMDLFDVAYQPKIATREPREYWRFGRFYVHDETNAAFVTFRLGVAYGAKLQRDEEESR
jgi:hypothetical protein